MEANRVCLFVFLLSLRRFITDVMTDTDANGARTRTRTRTEKIYLWVGENSKSISCSVLIRKLERLEKRERGAEPCGAAGGSDRGGVAGESQAQTPDGKHAEAP